MDLVTDLFQGLPGYLPSLGAALTVALVLWFSHRLLLGRNPNLGSEDKFPRQLLMLALSAAGLLLVLLPLSETTRGQILSLLGILLTAVIALSSTTFVTNIMAGLMLRVINSFGPGDFVRVGDLFGRVTQRGLIHTEIQTEERNLATLPNLYLVTQPLTVIHSPGTVVSTTVSLGYDIPRQRIEDRLKQAAEQAGQEEPFVRVETLGDFSVVYYVAGFLHEIKQLLTTRSNLRKAVMDALHHDGIEIVSPHFMNQRPIPDGKRFIPPRAKPTPTPPLDAEEEAPEELIFDKAEEAEKVERVRAQRAALEEQINHLQEQRKTGDETRQAAIDHELSQLQQQYDELARHLPEDSGGLPPKTI